MDTLTYNDGLHPGGRRPRLYLANAKGEAVRFEGSSIPGFCVVASREYQKNGKWSNTTFRLLLTPGARGIHFLSPLHGTWGDTMSSWDDAAKETCLPIDTIKKIVEQEYPKTAKRLNEVEAFVEASVEALGLSDATDESDIRRKIQEHREAIQEHQKAIEFLLSKLPQQQQKNEQDDLREFFLDLF